MPETSGPEPTVPGEETVAEQLRAAREAARESVGRQVDEELADRARGRAGEELVRLIAALAATAEVDRDSARYATVGQWRSAATTKTALITASVGLPGLSPFMIFPAVQALRRAVALGWGIGHVVGRTRGIETLVDAPEDAIAFLAHWTRLLTEHDLSSARIEATANGFALHGSSVAYRSFASAVISLRVGSFVDLADVIGGVRGNVPGAVPDCLRPILDEIHQRLEKLNSGGLAVGLLPVVGAVVGGAVGIYASHTIGDAAQRYYEVKAARLGGA
jgi:hypothetical protein